MWVGSAFFEVFWKDESKSRWKKLHTFSKSVWFVLWPRRGLFETLLCPFGHWETQPTISPRSVWATAASLAAFEIHQVDSTRIVPSRKFSTFWKMIWNVHRKQWRCNMLADFTVHRASNWCSSHENGIQWILLQKISRSMDPDPRARFGWDEGFRCHHSMQ